MEKHPERSIGSGELQTDDSVEDIIVKVTYTREPAKIGKRGHFGSSFLTAMELIMNILKFPAQKDVCKTVKTIFGCANFIGHFLDTGNMR